ncbi:MAG: hypothetical protein H5T99_11480, partial [Moorella sp. (in: Bacteria)]|nr:hypothetical protein [Moorella sp. (in: firmicutes)]
VRQASCDIFLQRLGRREHSFSFLGRAWALARRLSGEAGSLLPLLEDIEETAARVSGEWRDFWAALAQLSAAALWEQGNSTLRLTGHLKETPAWDSLLVTFGRLEAVLEGLSSRLGRLAELLYTTGAEEMAADAVNFGNICAQYSHDLGGILDADPGTSVSWLETNNAGQYTLHVAPLEIGPLLADLLFARKRAVILTSATMTVNNDFAFYQQQVGLAGLPAERLATCQVASPFDYRTQALVCTVRGLPNPGQMNDSAYAEAIVPVIARVLPAVGGRTLVLCTSHRLLRDIYNLLVNAPETTGYSIPAQGIDGGRSQLLEEFKHIPRAVLLGASSYWE